jgi:quercetin dioxygenase-like cupin family protein
VNQAHDVAALLAALPELDVTRATTDDQAIAAVRALDTLNGAMLGMVRFSGLTPWERHPGGDELLYVLDGEVEVTVLGDDRTVRATLRRGSTFGVPSGLWHRQHAQPSVALLFVTPAEQTGTSWAEDPRVDGGGAGAQRAGSAAQAASTASRSGPGGTA